jgi:hypothetical protein
MALPMAMAMAMAMAMMSRSCAHQAGKFALRRGVR